MLGRRFVIAIACGLTGAGCARTPHVQPRQREPIAQQAVTIDLDIEVRSVDLTDMCIEYTVVNRGGRLELWEGALGSIWHAIRLVDSEGRMVRLAPDPKTISDPGPGNTAAVLDVGERVSERACFGDHFWERYDESPAAAAPLRPPLTWVMQANLLGPSDTDFGPHPVLGPLIAGGRVPVVKRAGRVVP
jgi:hypothetical protein